MTKGSRICAIVLAGGKGTRMNSSLPKVLHKIAGKPIIFWTLELLKELNFENPIVVTGYEADLVKETIKKGGYEVSFARQEKSLGTADAVSEGLKKAPQDCKTILVLFGDDSALYTPDTIRKFLSYHQNSNHPMIIITVKKDQPTPLGGLEKDGEGNVIGILTQGQMLENGIKENDVVCGAFCFERKWLEENLPRVAKSKISGEYPLPALIKIAADQNLFTGTYELKNPNEWSSINTLEELKRADEVKRRMIFHGR